MPDREEVITDFDGLRIRSYFEIIEVEPDCVTFSIEWPTIKFDEEIEDE